MTIRSPAELAGLRSWTTQTLTAIYANCASIRTDVCLPNPDQDVAVSTLIGDTGLIVSELVTNALQAGSSEVKVNLTSHYDAVEIAVTDNSPGRPVPRAASGTAASGRGLAIVAALAIDWGYHARPTLTPSSDPVIDRASGIRSRRGRDGAGRHSAGEKVVWAIVRVPDEAQAALPCAHARL